MADLHFLRPAWLLLLLLVPLVAWLWRRSQAGGSGWEGVIPNPLLRPLLPSGPGPGMRRSRALWPALLLTITSLALAGPSWRQAPNPLEKLPDSLVIALDLSLSMLATDEPPNRLTRAKQKIRDLIPQRADAFTGLVAYAGDAHVVTPLTDDPRAIENLLPALDPFMMPALGSRADRAVETSIDLLQQGGRGGGTILLVTDGVDARYHEPIQDMISQSGYALRILAVGTPAGAPIPIPERGFLRDQGELVIPQLDMDDLSTLADMTDGEVARVTLLNDDLNQLDVTETLGSASAAADTVERRLNLWVDDGYWLVWLLAPLGLLAWRRGGLAVVLVAFTLPMPQTAQALEWEDLWLRQDQQGARLFPDNPEAAAEHFNDPAWRGSALYRAGDYEAAADAFARAQGADADYNRGNALARSGELEAAIEAYDAALEAEPGHEDARANKALVESLLEQQEQQQQEGDGQDGEPQEQPGQEGEQGDSQDPSQQPGSQQDSGQDAESNGSPGEPEGAEEESGEEPEQGEDGEPAQQEPSESEGQPSDGLLSDPQAQDERSREQWMRRVPDDPAGLLRRKFLYQYQQKDPDLEDSEPW